MNLKMKKVLKFVYLILEKIILSVLIFAFVQLEIVGAGKAKGPLKVSSVNPRYFEDGSDKIIYLTGSHTWSNLLDISPSDPPEPFDFISYLDWMQKYNHNFIRLWTWELSTWDTKGNGENKLHTIYPLPWARTGPGKALDDKPKFDLNQFNNDYFKRLRFCLETALSRGLYVSVMLFEGWGMQFSPGAWESHPFHPDNNINGINGDLNGDGKGLEIHTLLNSNITSLQETYVIKVIDTINDLDNILYEISNENHPPSTKWQYHIINFIHNYEKNKPKQHPVGMTFQYKGGNNKDLFDSPADWISPNPEGGYRDNPPSADGSKVILNDTDHLWGIGGNQQWIWKSFLRGMNTLFMDPYNGVVLGKPFDPKWEPIRKNLGYTRIYAEKMNLLQAVPHNELASTTYCLANPGSEYLVYQPTPDSSFTVNLKKGEYRYEWFNPNSGAVEKTGRVEVDEESFSFTAPFISDAVLYLKNVRK
jgi:hypothetical protein